MKKIYINIFTLVVIALFSTANTYAQEKKTDVIGFLDKIIDTFNRFSKRDSFYIEKPKKKFLVYGKYFASYKEIDIETPEIINSMDFSGSLPGLVLDNFNFGQITSELKTDVRHAMGFGASYRGLGLTYKWDVSHSINKDVQLAFHGSSIGVDVRWHKTDAMSGKIKMENRNKLVAAINEKIPESMREAASGGITNRLNDLGTISSGDVEIDNYIANGYYVFNSRKFSMPATYSPTTIQKHSAGSFFASASFNRAKIKIKKEILQSALNGVTEFSTTQFSLGVGYGYNFVTPDSKLLIHGSITPKIMYSSKGNAKVKDSATNEEKKVDVNSLADRYLGGNHHFTPTFLAHASVNYNFNKSWVLGSNFVIDYYRIGASRQYKINNTDWEFNAYLGFRF